MPRPKHKTPRYRLQIHHNGIWYIYWTEDGHPRRQTLGTRDHEEAQREFANFLVSLTEESLPADSTIPEIMWAYHRAREDKVSARTIEWGAKWADTLLKDIRPSSYSEDLEKRIAKQQREKDKRPWTNSSAHDFFRLVRAAVNWAIDKKMLPKDDRIDFKVQVPRSPPRKRWLTREEVVKLMNATVEPHMKTYVALSVFTGHRRGAILELTWDRVDFEKRLIDFGEGCDNKQRSIVPMNDTLFAELKAAHDRRTCDYVLEWRGKRIKHINCGLKVLARRAGVDNVYPHVFRHTAATWLAESNVPTREACRLLAMTEDIFEKNYAKHRPDYLRGAATALDL